jgi:hypothetical protein
MMTVTRPTPALAFVVVAALGFASQPAEAFGFRGGGGFHGGGLGGGGGFHGAAGGAWGGSRFGDGGYFDRGRDSGFGGNGFGNVRNSGAFSNGARTWSDNHPEFDRGRPGMPGGGGISPAHPIDPNGGGGVSPAHPINPNGGGVSPAHPYNPNWHWHGHSWSNNNYWINVYGPSWDGWGDYYGGLGFGDGFFLGATFAALPAEAYAMSIAGDNFWYADGVYYGYNGGQYIVVPPPVGAVIPNAPPSCSTVDFGNGETFDCGGAFYSAVPSGFQVVPPPLGATVTALPDGAQNESVGDATYFTFGGAWYQPVYMAGGVQYTVVSNPNPS